MPNLADYNDCPLPMASEPSKAQDVLKTQAVIVSNANMLSLLPTLGQS